MSNNYKTKDEVLKITNRYYISYYCKNDICVSTDYNYLDKTIEIPNDKGEIIKYITDTCRIDNINHCETNCTTNIECLLINVIIINVYSIMKLQ